MCQPRTSPGGSKGSENGNGHDGGAHSRRDLLKLAGAAIPLASRIIGVIDAYDTMTDAGRDRASAEPAGAVSELLRCGGTQFDPEALDAFLAVLGRH